MSVLAEPTAVNEPIRPADIHTDAGPVADVRYTDEAVLRIVREDFRTAEAWLTNNNWNMQWRESRILYQSPRTASTFEGTTVARANVPRFTVATQVNSLAPAIHGSVFSDPTPFQTNPRGRTTQAAAFAWRDLLSELLDDCDFKQEMSTGTEQMVNQGTVIFKAGWQQETRIEKHFRRVQAPPSQDLPLGGSIDIFTEESDEFGMEEEEVTRSRPFFEKCELGSVFIDPKWNKPNQLWKAKWVIHQHFVTYEDLKRLSQNKEYDIPDEETLRRLCFGDEEQTERVSSVEQALTQAGNGAITGAEDRDRHTSEDPLLKPLELLERWTNDTCMVTLQGKVVIRNGRHNQPTHGFFSANFWNLEDTGYGMGVGRIAGSDQRVDQGTINAALDIISHAINPEYAVARAANVPTGDLRKRLGGIRPVDGDPRQAYSLIQQPEVPPDAWRVTQMSREASASATGSDQAAVGGTLPARGGSSFGKSGTGAGIIGQASAGRLQSPIERLIDGVMIPVLNFFWAMVRERMPVSELRAILDDRPASALVVDMYDVMNARMKFDTLAGTRLKARAAMAQALPFLLQVFENQQLISQLNNTGYKVDVNELVGMVMDVSEWRNARTLVVPMTPEEQQSHQMAQQNQPNKLQEQMALLQQKHQNDTELEDQKMHGRLVGDVVKQSAGKVTESPLDRAANFATRDQLEAEMRGSQYFGAGLGATA